VGDKIRKLHYLGFFLITLIIVTATASASPAYRLNGEYWVANDTDSEFQSITALGADLIFNRKKDDRITIKFGEHHFSDKTGNEDFTFGSLWAGKTLGDTFRLEGSIVPYFSSVWSPVFWSDSLIITPSRQYRFELFNSRNIVDNTGSVRNKFFFDSYGISADWVIHPEITLVGAYVYEHISDGNDKNIEIVKVLYSPESYKWLNLGLSVRNFNNDFTSPFYYSPERYTETLAVVTVAQPLFNDKFAIKFNGGAGYRWTNVDNRFTGSANVRFKGWFDNHWGMELSGGYLDHGGTGAYQRWYGSVILLYAF
jgi:hypothetical protein